ncbi:hypothetical protein RIF29_09179 [Crotalaria pallida]|uniref:SAM-dependent MTase RsmB/NOP-type domain-containing protein n=1 Tax=Crotalaria pallida TaxID=3830 RepID=A0AAN9FZB3_CROPI
MILQVRYGTHVVVEVNMGEKRCEEAEAREREFEKQIASLGDLVSLEDKLLCRWLMFKKEFDSSYMGFKKDGTKWLVENTDIKLVGELSISFQGVFCHRKWKLGSLSLLKIGGRMVYSTCSMNPVENEAVVAEKISMDILRKDNTHKLRNVIDQGM